MASDIIEHLFQNDDCISIADYINYCLYSRNGFYNSTNVFGRHGHFITSPMITSVFGEMIGLYFVNIIQEYLSDDEGIALLEIGGGNGQFMFDVLHSISQFPQILERLDIYSIEQSQSNIITQRKLLNGYNINYLNDIQDFKTNKKTILFSNEWLDAYPVDQYAFYNQVWQKVYIQNSYNNLSLVSKNVHHNELGIISQYCSLSDISGEEGLIIEIPHKALQDFDYIVQHQNVFAMLHFDYGKSGCYKTSTLQALYKHEQKNILEMPRECDITHLVNFLPFQQKVTPHYAICDVLRQSEFLQSIGIYEYAAILQKKLSPENRCRLNESLGRIMAQPGMGDEFKVLVAIK